MCRVIRTTSFIFFLFLSTCSEENAPVSIGAFESMGTIIHVQPKIAVATVKGVFDRIDKEMSEWKHDSFLAQVNQSAGKSSVRCSEDTVKAIALSLSIAKSTKGAFDPTWAAMWELWDFKEPKIPIDQEVRSRLQLVNWKNVKLTQDTVYLTDKGMMLGLGGIAKGVALNEARKKLLSEGVHDFLLQCGGQVLAQGNERIIGIRKPDGLQNEIIGTIAIQNQSISTSGNYEKYFVLDGVRYHHILDPRTGYPAKGMKSVTVLSENAALGDALSTGLFVMGTFKGMELVERTEGVEALFIDSQNVVYKSSGFYFE
jgi:thiamine biosynthesis lipoprotein